MPELTDIADQPPGARRALHGMGHRRKLRFLRRAASVATELARAAVLDRRPGVRGGILRLEEGRAAVPGGRSVALYVHYSRTGRVSAMVRQQLRLYAAAGFNVVFVSVAPSLPQADWDAVRDTAALVVHRRNHGLDFGAWQELAPEALRRWPDMDELLLCNDSVLGPIRPLGPVFAALRAGGDGVFGLTESAQGGPHLQSYFVLARGQAAVSALCGFLAAMRLSASKWLIVQRGELSLSRTLLREGQRVAALFGYVPLVEAALRDPVERDGIAALVGGGGALRDTLLAWPRNPAHHFWRALVRCQGFPFIKTELVRRNPGGLPGVEEWPALVGPDSPCSAAIIREHLALMGE